jgi:hypothetical protein
MPSGSTRKLNSKEENADEWKEEQNRDQFAGNGLRDRSVQPGACKLDLFGLF